MVMVLGGLWGHLCGLGVSRFLDVDERPWLAIVVMAVVITGPLSVIVWAATVCSSTRNSIHWRLCPS